MLIRFNKKIYSEKIIKETIKSYVHLAKFSFSQNKNYFLVKINKTKPEVKDKLSDEFSNYVLSLMKK